MEWPERRLLPYSARPRPERDTAGAMSQENVEVIVRAIEAVKYFDSPAASRGGVPIRERLPAERPRPETAGLAPPGVGT